ncbi:hypothetical protein PoB_001618100 [Plakobranchus ocellatus]|uniref:Uncharacterized protein n=1 Tax=Plakobranchus ocellatus TaxID=259542 RepID=A0AAV3YRB4_9GAST|nr:hypothetical protein PoB_001618100 [Plakobranchus ocellatus]
MWPLHTRELYVEPGDNCPLQRQRGRHFARTSPAAVCSFHLFIVQWAQPCNRGIPADLRADSLATVPPTPRITVSAPTSKQGTGTKRCLNKEHGVSLFISNIQGYSYRNQNFKN